MAFIEAGCNVGAGGNRVVVELLKELGRQIPFWDTTHQESRARLGQDISAASHASIHLATQYDASTRLGDCDKRWVGTANLTLRHVEKIKQEKLSH